MAAPADPASESGARLTLLVRAYCHLCDDMREALVPLARAHGAGITEIDVDTDPALESRYGDRVPVLLLGVPEGGEELCHYFLDALRVRAALERSARR
ncbi:MAG TPA: glutaredoxin family protein [Casimicrobiaceae bacterium]|nr:glutaredoxin family protein [Casimicrobiaceae bacterium]